MSQSTVSAAARAARPRRRPSSLTRAVAEALESRRLLAAPQVTPPPPPPAPGDPWINGDGHFDFEAATTPHKQKLVVGFDQPVTLAPNALSLTNLTTGAPYTDLTQAGPGSSNDYTWTVAGQGDQNVTGALPRGNYELLINDFAVTNGDGQTLDGNTGIATNETVGGSGDDYVSRFHFQPGDANHDRLVTGDDYSNIDFGVLFPGMNGYSNGDFNYDGAVTQADYDIIRAWYGTALPAPPSDANELIAAAGRGFIDLTWTPPQTDANGNAIGVDGYKIYRSLDAGATWTLRHTLTDPAATHWQDTGLADGTKYTYRVRPYNADGAGVTTNKYWTVTNLPAPSNLTASNITGHSLTLSWTPESTNYSGFLIYASAGGGEPQLVGETAGNVTSFDVTGLDEAVAYSFSVEGVSGTDGSSGATPTQKSAPSQPEDVKTPHEPAADFTRVYGPGAPSYIESEWAPTTTWTNPMTGQTTDIVDYQINGSVTLSLSNLPRHTHANLLARVTTHAPGESDWANMKVEFDVDGTTIASGPGGAHWSPDGDGTWTVERAFYAGAPEIFKHSGDTMTVTFKTSDFPDRSRWSIDLCEVTTILPMVTITGGGSIAEGEGRTFTVRRSVVLDEPLEVKLKKGGSASNTDYTAIPDSVTLEPNEAEYSFNVITVDDAVAEDQPAPEPGEDEPLPENPPEPTRENVTVAIADSEKYLSSDEPVTLTIVDDSAWFYDASWKVRSKPEPMRSPPVFKGTSVESNMIGNDALETVEKKIWEYEEWVPQYQWAESSDRYGKDVQLDFSLSITNQTQWGYSIGGAAGTPTTSVNITFYEYQKATGGTTGISVNKSAVAANDEKVRVVLMLLRKVFIIQEKKYYNNSLISESTSQQSGFMSDTNYAVFGLKRYWLDSDDPKTNSLMATEPSIGSSDGLLE